MNHFLLIILLGVGTLLSGVPGEYVHKRNGNKYSLLINDDSTFTYSRPAIFSGIITETGSWKIKNAYLILLDSIGKRFSESSITSTKIERQNYITIKVMDENMNPLTKLTVALNNDHNFKTTDELGVAKFKYSELKKTRMNQPDSTVEIVELKGDKWSQKSAVVDIFSNDFILVKNFNPETKYESRIRKIEIKNGVLIFPNPTGMNEDQVFEFKKRK